jgi:hypothetical protein
MNIGLASILLDGRHVSMLSYSLAEARLAAALAERGLAPRLYDGRPEGSVAEISRQLARMRSDLFLFSVDAATASLGRELAMGLARLRPQARCLFWIREPLHPQMEAGLSLVGQKIDAAGVADAADLICALAGCAPAAPAAPPSPYLKATVPPEDVYRLGFSLAQLPEALDEELQWLESLPADLRPVSLEGGEIGEAQTIAMLERLRLHPERRFLLHSRSEILTPQVVLALAGTPLTGVVLADGPAPDGLDIGYLDIPVSGAGTADAAARERSSLYARNGVAVALTGLYHDANLSPAIYHLEMPLAIPIEQRRQGYAWAAPNLALKSAALTTGASQLVDMQLTQFSPVGGSSETGGWPRHVYALGDNPAGLSRLHVDGDPAVARAIRFVPLSRFDEGAAEPDILTTLTVREPEDADALETRLRLFHNEGRARFAHPRFGVAFENSCRWLGYSACRLSVLRRLQVQDDLQVTACRDSPPIGRVGDPYERLLVATRHQQQMEEVNRGCATCAVRDQCSRCSQLPESWGGRYCGIRRSYPATTLYFELRSLLQLLGPGVSGEGTAVEITVSASGLPMQGYGGRSSILRSGERPVIVGVGGQNYSWIRGTRKVTKLSNPLVAMVEGWWMGATEEELVQDLSASFAVDSATAASSLATGMAKLRQVELVHG